MTENNKRFSLSEISKLTLSSALIILVLILNQFLIQYYLSNSKTDSHLINIAGRQRMLSQKISLEAYKTYSNKINKDKIQLLFRELKESHSYLINETSQRRSIASHDSSALQKLFKLTNTIEAIESIIESKLPYTKQEIIALDSQCFNFLVQMEVIVMEVELNSNERLNFIMNLAILLSLISIFIILIVFQFLYKKVYNKNKSTLSKTLISLEDLETKFKELQSIEFGLNNSFLVSITDINDVILNVNNKFCDVTKYTKNELIGKSQRIFNSGYHDDDFWKKLYTNVLNGQIWRNEVKNLDKEGNVFWVDTVVTPIFDTTGKITRLMSIRQDITEKKKTEEELLLTTSILNEAQTISNIGGWQLDLKSQELFWTNEVYNIYELDLSTPLNKDFALSFYHPVYKQIISKLTEDAIKNGTEFDKEALFISSEGNIKWVRILAKPVYYNSKLTKLIGIIQDITTQKDKEKLYDNTNHRLTLATKIAKIGIWDLDLIANNLFWDAEMYRLYGIKQSSFRENVDFWSEFVHPEDIDRFSQELTEAIEEIKPFDTQFRIIWKDGSMHHIKALAEVVINENGITTNVIGTNWDITDIKEYEEKLKQSKNLAEQASKAKSEFLANMSHEIRTPLNGVIGFTDILLNTDLSSTQREYLSIVNNSAHTLLDVISDILDFSKIEAGKMELSITKVNLFTLVNKIANLLQFQIQTKNIEFLLDIDPNEVPQFLWTDEIRLKQILINLLSNALKFTEKGEIELKIQKKNNGLTFSVRDTGIGIDQHNQKKIFQAFDQADNSSTRKYGGTGLGLSISNSILSMMDSKLLLKSEVEHGSTFYFELFAPMDHGNVLAEYPNVNMKNILIVDDNLNNRKILNTMLSYFDIHSIEAEDGIQAINILHENNNFDLIFMDYHMPHQDGLETISIIRKEELVDTRKTPIVLFHSKIVDPEFSEKLNLLEIDYEINKPMDFKKLSECLAHHGSININKIIPSNESNTLLISDKQHNLSILLVEDNEVNMQLAKVIIRRSFPNIQLKTAKNGKEALSIFLSNPLSLIVTDIQMPELNGYQLTEEIRKLKINNDIPIIALTAGTIKGEKEKCIEIGMNDYISKPILEKELKAVISKWLFIDNEPS